jgi:septal ring factor EnvC (AmiA/AmiB activator)
MLGLLGIKQYIYMAIGGVLLTSAFIAYKYYTDTQLTITTLTANNARLEQAVALNEETVRTLRANYNRVVEENRRVSEEFSQSRTQVDELQKKLSEHDIGFLAEEKPGLIENIINNATDEIFREFEELSK